MPIYDIPLSSLYKDGYTDRLGLSSWIAENTRADLVYLDSIPTPSAQITAEIAATEPQTLDTKRDVCTETYDTLGGIWET